jgi:hypothetical protein
MNSSPEKLPADDGYRGIWYYCNGLGGEYKYKYSGGLGTYCAKHIPLAAYAPEAEKTFFCYGGRQKAKNSLLHMVACYDHRTGKVCRPRILLDKQTDDAHDNAVILLDEEGYVCVFSSAHGTARPAHISRSVEPYSIEAFERIYSQNFSYPQPWHVPGRGILWLHTLYRQGRRLLHWTTSPDGRGWQEPRLLSAIENGHYQVSRRRGQKVGTAFNYHPAEKGANFRTNLYYVETDDFGRTWRTIRGEAVETPITKIDSPALVHDFRAQGLLVYLKDLNFDAEGNPVVLVVTSRGWQPGPLSGPRTWTTARWNGRGWEIRGSIESDSNYDTGCLHVGGDGTWRLVGPTEPGPQPFNPGGEMALWVSGDCGASWRKLRQVTQGSGFNHTYARRPVNAHADFYAFWADGHGREPSESRLYFCNAAGEALRLPAHMTEEWARPERVG